ncbi:MAG: PAQR family membrane homeostasis protein TrhA, partial [Acidimicrobiia bacterium]
MNGTPASRPDRAPGADLVPRWRGRLHAAATVAWIPAGAMLVGRAASTRDRLALGVYVLSIGSMFAVSAAFHLGRWSSVRRATLGRLDHSMIFVAIAGTYTPFSVIAMPQPLGAAVLVTVWLGAIGGIALRLVWKDGRPRPGRVILAGPYVALGWVGVVAFPQ